MCPQIDQLYFKLALIIYNVLVVIDLLVFFYVINIYYFIYVFFLKLFWIIVYNKL